MHETSETSGRINEKEEQNIPSWKRSFSTRSITVGGGKTIEDLRLSEPGFSAATDEKQG